MKDQGNYKRVLETVQTLCIVATTAAVIWFLWNMAPLLVTFD